MKPFFWIVALLTLSYAVATGAGWQSRDVLVISGATDGYLSPCGCVKPMSGGLRRRISAIRQLSAPGRTTVIDNGGFVKGLGRQDEMKAEAVAETMKLVKVAAINFGLEEARMGAGMASALDRLSGGAMVATGLSGSSLGLSQFKASGPFLIGGIDPRTRELGSAAGFPVVDVDSSVRALLAEAKAAGLVPVLMTRGGLEESVKLAERHPSLKLIVCALKSAPLVEPRKVGGTLIVTPGEHAKAIVKIEWDGKDFVYYKAIDLGPEYPDDPQAQEVYASYLARVAREDLLAMVPRSESAAFAGNKSCSTCHAAEARVWNKSAHAQALSTLETDGHDKDPDCVGCHVVGLRSVGGFVSRKATPLLTDVGCESCHGPGREHSMRPIKEKMPEVGAASCAPCHNAEHSPTFDFETYWAKIKH